MKTPPRAAKIPVSVTHHGISKTDDYSWLRDANWQKVMRDPSALNPDIRKYLEDENQYTKAGLAHTESLQDQLFDEMKGRIKEDDSSVPQNDGPYSYNTRFIEGGQYPLMVRTPIDGGDEQLLFDGNKQAEGKSFFRLGNIQHSPDHKLLSWAVDEKGSEYYTLRVRDIATGNELTDKVEGNTGGCVWTADSKAFYYTRLDDNHRPCQIFRHELGTTSHNDVLIYEEKDPGFFVGIGKSQSGQTIFIDSHDHQTSEIRFLNANGRDTDPVLICERQTSHEYSVDEANGVLYILTNRDGAEDFKLMTARVEDCGLENWSELVSHKQGCLVLSHTSYKSFLVRLEREDGLPRIVIHHFADGREETIAFPEEAYSLGLGGSYEFATNTVRFTYSSMTTPARVFDYDVATGEQQLRKEQEIPSGHNIDDYVTRRLMVSAHDGAKVPVSLLYHKDTPIDGTAPCLLYGYGSYGISIPSAFSSNALSLVDRGFVYAIAHIRGGKEKGFSWYNDGRHKTKLNTFRDFISVANFLIEQNYTAQGRIVAEGGSAGGMLMGAVTNMSPDLWAGVMAIVPFVDVLNTMLDDTLPLTPPEWPEWGNPIQSREDYEIIASYSPYDQVTAMDYPPILAVAGLTDPRVTYWEPAKWVAKMRELKTDSNPLYLKTNMEAGHAGASGRFDRLKEKALEWAFALDVTEKT
ncbi:MAG: S9 family peptidase [Cohaesibacteraceae bacterium]|nr:S9 family peptidase [Cohaesibacteraceae bacterium]